MTDNSIEKESEEVIQSANSEFDISDDSYMSFSEYLTEVQANPNIAAHSVEYILDAIEYFGKREIFEDGEEKERYVFFDDPYGNGEHAVLGNTDILNDFVNDLRRMASEEGENNKIIWFNGPTATGKSELKRCLINGIKGYSKTDEGAKYTIEWTLDNFDTNSRMSYGSSIQDSRNWYKSPINVEPISLLPEETRTKFWNEINHKIPASSMTDVDPFSKEVRNVISEEAKDFADIVSDDNLRVRRYYPEVGDGIGVLHTEDDGNEKVRLVGGWMEGAMSQFAERGRKNPQAFSFEGVLSQGNRTMSIVEDASHHSDVLDKLMNVCEEKMVKLDNKIKMDIDTLITIFSNPDLEGQLSQYSEKVHKDPLRALRRRMNKYDFSYLTTADLEALLLRRILTNENYSMEDFDGEDVLYDSLEIYDCELAPRAIEAAAKYEIITRINRQVAGIQNIEKVVLLNNGEVETEEGKLVKFDDVTDSIKESSLGGMPVTYTVDVIVDLAQENNVVLPDDVISSLSDSLTDYSIFDDSEGGLMENMALDISYHIMQKQEKDVLDAMVGDISVSEDEVRDYIDSVFAWKEDDEENYDLYEMREFEVRNLGLSEDSYDENAEPTADTISFRDNIIINPVKKYLWESTDSDYTVEDIPLSECPELESLLDENDWDMVERVFPDLDYAEWRNAPSNTDTEELKEKTIKRMCENGYSEESAKKVSTKVVEGKEKQSKLYSELEGE